MRKRILTEEDIKTFEHISPAASKKYVPIKTSEFVKALSSHFKLEYGAQYRVGSTGHYVKMNKGESDVSLYIENSFDRTMALRMSFDYKGFVFGRIKQVHKGKPALDMIGTIDEIKSWYHNAIGSIDAMRTLDISQADMEAIANQAFKDRGLPSSRMISNMKYNHANALDFVLYLVNGLRKGSFTRHSPKGIIPLKPVTQESLIVQINSKIWKYLAKNNPELYV